MAVWYTSGCEDDCGLLKVLLDQALVGIHVRVVRPRL